MKWVTLQVLTLVTVLTSCNGQTTTQTKNKALSEQESAIAIGDTVSAMDKAIFTIYQAKNHEFWFGSDGQGVYRYDGVNIIHFTTKHGLCNSRIREIQEDKSGNVFFTTLHGISKFDGQKFTTISVAKSDEWKLDADDLWFRGEPGKNGPYRYDGDSLYHLEFSKHFMEDEFYAMNPNPPYSPYEVYYIFKDSKNNVWFGTSNLGVGRYDGKSISWMYEEHMTTIESTGGSFGIRSIIEDKDGVFWFCNTRYRYNILPASSTDQDKTTIHYKREKGIDDIKTTDGEDMIYFMSALIDKHGNMWMATYNQGVWKYDGESITHYPVNDGTKDISLVSIYKDREEALWLGTHEAGAYKFIGKTFENFKP